MSSAWSEQLAARYALKLPHDLCEWFDRELWRLPGGAEFHQPLAPAALLDPHREQLWAGFMLPDTLPLIGNDYGDWLCLRADEAGHVAEIVCWSHAGGDWTPVGRTLSEALLYDAASRLVHSRRPEFAGEPEPPHDEVFRSAQWALASLNGERDKVGEFWQRKKCKAGELLRSLISAGVAEFAARRDLILAGLHSELKRHADPKLARELGTTWEPDFVSWLFDTDLIPAKQRNELSRRLERPIGPLTKQDWAAAEREAIAVCERRSDLGWAFDIAGWAAERRGDFSTAIRFYRQGLQTSLFADDTVRFRTHWFAEGLGKFAAARLAALEKHLPADSPPDPYLDLFWENDAASLRERLCEFWLERAAQAEARGLPGVAYRCFYNAGWDLGLRSVEDFDVILTGLTRTATTAGWPALAQIAAAHRQCLPMVAH